MPQKRISRDKIITAFLMLSFDKSAGAVSLSDIADSLGVKKASLYNHFSSREEMYVATVDFCAEYLKNISFIENGNSDFRKLILQYFRSHTMEPLIQIYSFIHSEKYFNETATAAAEKHYQKIFSEIKQMLPEKSENVVQIISTLIAENLDSYILQRKDSIRKNPEQVAGSLFELPFEESVQEKLIALVTEILEQK